MKILYALALTLLLGCTTTKLPQPSSPRPVVTGVVVSYRTIEAELRPLMAEHYKPQLISMDAYYGCVSEQHTRRIIAEALSTFNTHYIEESLDCDDLAINLVVQMRALFRRDTAYVPLASTFGVVGGALAGDIPELGYKDEGLFFHAMVIVRCQNGKYLLIEPQSKQICEFTGLIYEGVFDFILGIF